VEAAALHRDALVLDGHCDTVLGLLAGRDFLQGGPEGQVDLPRLRAGGVKVQIFALFVEGEYKPDRALARVLRLWDALAQTIAASAGQVVLCRSAAELDAAVAAGRLAAILSVEGAEPIGTDLSLLRALHALGVRALGLTWNQRNAIADGAGEVRANGGLTEFGREAVAECERLGIVVDVSHLCERAFWDVLGVARGPVIASHSNARALCDHVRNLHDAQIRALAAAGGVMGMNFFPLFLDADPARVDVARVCDHIDHIQALVGPGHVGLGSDFDGISSTPRGLEDCSRLPALTEELLRRGHGEAEVRGILGGNFLRVLRQVWGAGRPPV